MAGMDFPYPATNGQTTTDGRYYFDSSVGSTGAWRSTPLPVGGLPAGSIMAWGTNTPPANWLLADGTAVSRSTYSSLFAVIGTQYGAGNGTTTFNLPDLRGRVPVGRNGGTFGTLGATGGAETHTLSLNEIPSHSHTLNGNLGTQAGTPNNSSYVAAANNSYGLVAGGAGIFAGGGQAHNNLQPYQVVNYIIKASAGWTAGDSELATRIGALETADATTNKSGLVPIVPSSVSVGSGSASVGANGLVTFTGASTLTLEGVGSTTYRNLKGILTVDSNSASGNVFIRVGPTTTNSGYYWSGSKVVAGSTTVTADGAVNDSSFGIGYLFSASSNRFFADFNVTNLNVAARTSITSVSSGGNSGDSYVGMQMQGTQVTLSSFTSLSFLAGAGNFTGSIQLYGYR